MKGTVTLNTDEFLGMMRENEAMKSRIEKLENYIMNDNLICESTGDYRFVYIDTMKSLGITEEQMEIFKKVKEFEN